METVRVVIGKRGSKGVVGRCGYVVQRHDPSAGAIDGEEGIAQLKG